MNILYISRLSGNASSGPTYSIPNQIAAQSKLDNVFWYNISKSKGDIFKKYPFYHDITEYPNEKIEDLPIPFNNPDLAIIEEVYVYRNPKILYDVLKMGIPYIIVPRSQLTIQAQNQKSFKKKIGNFLIYNRIIRNAYSIQFLSEQEMADSSQWKVNGYVMPNGINEKSKIKTDFSSESIKAVYIGRIAPYQKGLDILVEAIYPIKDQLLQANLIISIVGSVKDTISVERLCNTIKEYGLSEVIKVTPTPLFGEDKVKRLLASDLFIMTSRFEGLSMGLLEAISLGLPCLVTRGTNMKDEVEESNAGWTADNNVESIRSALLRVIAERNLLKLKGENALRLSKKYNWDEIAKQSHSYYENVKLYKE